jgi:hypothetical protein
MESKGFSTSSIFPESTIPTSLCERCITLDFRRLGLVASEQFAFLKSRAKVCTLCQLLLHMFGTGNRDIADIWRVKGGLTDRDGGTPILSIYRIPCK